MLNYALYPHHVPHLLALTLLFTFYKDTRKMQYIAIDLGNESEGMVCVWIFDDETRDC